MRNKYFIFLLFGLFSFAFSQTNKSIKENITVELESDEQIYPGTRFTNEEYREKFEEKFKVQAKLKSNSSNNLKVKPNINWADQILIVGKFPDGGSDRNLIKSTAEALGHVVTTVDEVYPSDVSGYDQIWDIRGLGVRHSGSDLTSEDEAKLRTVLANGGTVWLSGEVPPYYGARNDKVEAFIKSVGGGDDFKIKTSGYETGTFYVQNNFKTPNDISQVSLLSAGYIDNIGNGEKILVASSGKVSSAVWHSSDLGSSYSGKLIILLDTNWLTSSYVNKSGHDNIKFLKNMLAMAAKVLAPTISSSSLSNDNSYIDITISEAVYNTDGGSGALEASDFTLTFEGLSYLPATGVTISSIKKNDNTSEGSATALSGGETVVRVFLNITGIPNGAETVTITPVEGLSVFNADGRGMAAIETTGAITLNDQLKPTIRTVGKNNVGRLASADNTEIAVSMSEAVFNTSGGSGALQASDFVFTISGGTAILGSATPTSISNEGSDYTLGISLSSASNGLDTLFLNIVDDSIYDGAGNEADTLQSNSVINNIMNNAAILNDITAPTIVSVSSPTADGLYKIGDDLAVTVTFSEVINVIGSPQLKLETGSNNAFNNALIDYASGSGSSVLTFNYSVSSGQASSDLDYVDSTSLLLNNGSIKDVTGNIANISLPTPGLAGSLSSNKALVIDGIAPMILSSVLSSDNSFVDLTMSEAVYNTINGSGALEASDFTLTLTQNSGNTSAVTISSIKKNDNATEGSATALSGGEAVVRVFLNITGTPSGVESIAITPVNESSIYDLAGNSMVTTQSNGVKVLNDKLVATTSKILLRSDNRTIEITFSEPVFSDCNGSALDINDFVISFGGGKYADKHTDFVTIPASISINGNIYTLGFSTPSVPYGQEKAIFNPAANSIYDANCNLVAVSQIITSVVLYDEAPPEISSVALATNNTSIAVTMSEATFNTSNGSGALEANDFSLTINGGVAELSSSTPTSISANGNIITLGFGLTGVPNGAEVLLVNPVNDGIYDTIGNEAAIFQTNNFALLNDNISPIITSVSLSANNSSLAVTMSEAVYNTNEGSGALEASDFVFSITLGSATLSSTTPTSISKSGNIYTLGVGLSGTADGAEVLVVNPIDDSIYDLIGNEASNSQSNNIVNLKSKIVPIITSVALASDNSTIAVTFSEAVTNASGGSGALEKTDFVLSITGGNATLASTTPTAISISSNVYTLTLSLTDTPDGSELLVVNPKDDSIYDSDNNEASTSQINNFINLNDNTVPTVTSVSSITANGTYGIGGVLEVTTIFNEEVFVTGSPQMTLETGSTDAVVNYSSGSGTNTLVFNYTVVAGDTTNDLDYTATTSLGLNSGTIKDAAANVAVLTLVSPAATYSLGANKALIIDGNAPTVNSVTSSKANGSYGVNDVIPISISFSQSITVTGTPQLKLETGTIDGLASYASGTGSKDIVFNYTIGSGENSSDLDYTSTTALDLNGGTLKDASGNAAILTLSAPAATNSLGANKALVIDTNGPTVVSVSSTNEDGAYKSGDTVNLVVTFNENTVVTGNPKISLETGVKDRIGNYLSGSGSTGLIFQYIVNLDDHSSDLEYQTISSLILNAGTIKDSQGNNALLTLPVPGETNSLSANKAIVIDNIAPLVSNLVEGSLVISTDLDFQGDTSSLKLAWSGSDTLSGISKYEYALGTSKGGVETIAWSNISTSTSITVSDLSLVENTKYYALVRATDNAGNVSAIMIGDGITVDLSSPIGGIVNDGLIADIAYTSALNTLSGNWTTFSDQISGIGDYQYAIGTTLNGTDVKDWASNGIDTLFTYSGHELLNTQAYYLSVKAIDNVGNISDTISSNGVISDQEKPMMGQVIDGISIDRAFTSADTIYASWSGFADSLSGISKYQYAVGSSPELTDVVSWKENIDSIKTNLSLGVLLKDKNNYYVSVRAFDGASNISAVATSDGITADFMPPSINSVSIEEGAILPLLSDTTINFIMSEPIKNIAINTISRLGATINYELDRYIGLTEGTSTSEISLTIKNPLISGDEISIKIDGLTDEAGNITNNIVYTYKVSLLGDYDLDGDIGVLDLATFMDGWKSKDLSLQLGPTVGQVPNLKPVLDQKFDSRDMMAFTRMWHWNSNKLSKQQTRMIADQGSALNATIKSDHIIFNPPKGTKAVELILDYPSSDIQFTMPMNKEISDEGLALSSLDTLNGRLVYQIGYFEQNNKSIRINTKHLQKNDIAVNLTYQFIGEDNMILSAGSDAMDITPVPSEFSLHDNYPNPFNPITTINYDLPKDAYVNLIIYDILGREVANLAGKKMLAGYQTITWNTRNNEGNPVAAGIYFYQIQTRDFVKTKKMVLLK